MRRGSEEAFSSINPATERPLKTPTLRTLEMTVLRFLKNYLRNSGPYIQPTIMKKSKLDLHRDFVMQRLQSKTSISKIRRDLAERGCSISHSALSEWIDTTAAAQGIQLPPRKRGRPKKSNPALLAFLPEEGELDPELQTLPVFLFAIQEMPAEIMRSCRNHALEHLGLPKSLIFSSLESNVLERLASLTDVELCLLALLRSDLPAPPLTKGHEKLTRWFYDLVECACKLRSEIREACKTRAR
jgi:hypothetical protein